MSHEYPKGYKQSTVEIVLTKVRQNKANNYSKKQRENIWLFIIIVKKIPKSVM